MKEPTRHAQNFERHQNIRFQLDDDLTNEGELTVTRMKFSTSSAEWETSDQTVEVWNVDDAHTGLEGDLGVAAWMPEAKRYEIISLTKGKARFITFKINKPGGLTGSDPTVEVDNINFYHGSDPGATVTVQTPGPWEADDNAVGWAWYDGTTYRMGNLSCPA